MLMMGVVLEMPESAITIRCRSAMTREKLEPEVWTVDQGT
jgi:hypothetical protein